MKLDDPKINEHVAAHRKAKRTEHQKSKGQVPMQAVSVTICKTCRTHVGTFKKDAKDARGRLYHVDCPGEKKEKSMVSRIRDIVK